MRAAYVEELGDRDQIRYGDLPDPQPGPGEVLVRVAAVAVDPVDTFVRSGRWPTEVRLPLVLGRDLVGTVAAPGPDGDSVDDVGTGADPLAVGQAVWTNSAGFAGRPGATSELVVVRRERLYPLPGEVDPVAFVATVHPGATAYTALVALARVQRGETVTVVGANGSVGQCLVQVASTVGARVVAVVREPAATERLQALGADEVVVAPADALATALPGGTDVLVDTTGHADLAASVELVAPGGRVVVVTGRGTVELDVWSFYTRGVQLLGFVLSRLSVAELAAAAGWLNEHPLRVSIGAVRTFADLAHAHELIETGRLPRLADGTVGRIVLRP